MGSMWLGSNWHGVQMTCTHVIYKFEIDEPLCVEAFFTTEENISRNSVIMWGSRRKVVYWVWSMLDCVRVLMFMF